MGKDGDIDGVWRPLVRPPGLLARIATAFGLRAGGGAGDLILMYRLRPATPEELERARAMQAEREEEAKRGERQEHNG